MSSETGSKLREGHIFGLERATFKWYFGHTAEKVKVNGQMKTEVCKRMKKELVWVLETERQHDFM